MNLNEIYTACNYIANKNKSGNAFNINHFNHLIELLTPDFFKKKIEESGYFIRGRDLTEREGLLSSKILEELIANETVAIGGALTYDFAYNIGAHDSDNNITVRLIEEQEYHDRVGDSVLAPSAAYPVMMIRDGAITVYPDSIANINISYYRYPNTPFLDYYIDDNGVIQFLSDGATHTWADDEIDSSGESHSAGDPDWTSLTEELEFDVDLHDDFLNEIMSRVGINLKEGMISQYAEQRKAEQRSA